MLRALPADLEARADQGDSGAPDHPLIDHSGHRVISGGRTTGRRKIRKNSSRTLRTGIEVRLVRPSGDFSDYVSTAWQPAIRPTSRSSPAEPGRSLAGQGRLMSLGRYVDMHRLEAGTESLPRFHGNGRGRTARGPLTGHCTAPVDVNLKSIIWYPVPDSVSRLTIPRTWEELDDADRPNDRGRSHAMVHGVEVG